MSKISERLTKLGQTERSGFGFGARATSTKVPVILIGMSIKKASEAANVNADLFILGADAKGAAQATAVKDAEIWGVSVSGGSAKEIDAAVEAGADFVVAEGESAPGAVEPDIHIMTIQGVQGSLPFILENKDLEILLYKDSLRLSKIVGSKENDIAQNYMHTISKFRERNHALMGQFSQAKKTNDTQFLKSYRNKRLEVQSENENYNLEFLEENNNSLFALLMLENFAKNKSNRCKGDK